MAKNQRRGHPKRQRIGKTAKGQNNRRRARRSEGTPGQFEGMSGGQVQRITGQKQSDPRQSDGAIAARCQK